MTHSWTQPPAPRDHPWLLPPNTSGFSGFVWGPFSSRRCGPPETQTGSRRRLHVPVSRVGAGGAQLAAEKRVWDSAPWTARRLPPFPRGRRAPRTLRGHPAALRCAPASKGPTGGGRGQALGRGWTLPSGAQSNARAAGRAAAANEPMSTTKQEKTELSSNSLNPAPAALLLRCVPSL